MFPIRDVKGEVIGFGARVMEGGGEPKYLNSPETPVFVKGRELYGLFEARQAIRERGYVLVTEGYMDVVALAQLGFANAVATLGTACTADHVAKLLRFSEHIVFSFDGDAAGRRAAGRAMEAVLTHATDTRSFRFLFLPPEHDPDSFVREQGAAAFEAQIEQALPLSRQVLAQAGEGCDLTTAEGRSRMLATARPWLEQLPSGLLREQMLDELARHGGVGADTLRSHWALATTGQRPARPRAADTAPSHDGDPRAEPATSDTRQRWRRDSGARYTPARRAPLRTATPLDRAAQILLHKADLWLQYPPELHELLCDAPPPYGELFARFERVLHDQGPLPLHGLVDELLRDDGGQDEALRAVVERLRALHELGDEGDAAEQLQAILNGLKLDAVNDEINLLLESGELSEAAVQRRNELMALRASLKARA
jgi:DNA primase